MPEGARIVVSFVVGLFVTVTFRGGNPFKGSHESRYMGDLVVLVILSIIMYSFLGLITSEPSYPSDRIPVGPELPVSKQEVELLHNTNTVVSVSSSQPSPKLSPKSMLDGDFETAWNSQSGDLIGARISFEVPAAAHVNTIRLTVGFTGSNEKGDLFVLNHRIRKIALARNGLRIGEFFLETENRSLQALPVGLDGGKYTIVVLETLPGQKANWREVCVSEMVVWGFLPPNEKPIKQMPTILVSSEAKGAAKVVPAPTNATPNTPNPNAKPSDMPTAMSSAQADSLLSEAQEKYVERDFAQAIARARRAAQTNPTRAWRIIGAAACAIRDLKLANEAHKQLDARGQEYLTFSCQRQGITHTGTQFKDGEN